MSRLAFNGCGSERQDPTLDLTPVWRTWGVRAIPEIPYSASSERDHSLNRVGPWWMCQGK
jgi:hypothetical protein